MNEEKKVNEFIVFSADVKKLTDEQLLASLQELRKLTTDKGSRVTVQDTFRRRAA